MRSPTTAPPETSFTLVVGGTVSLSAGRGRRRNAASFAGTVIEVTGVGFPPV